MGKQYNKVIKRRRRNAYVARKKEAAGAVKVVPRKTKAKAPVKRATKPLAAVAAPAPSPAAE